MTFKRHYHEDGLTETHYDYLLPVADPITVLPTTPLTITKETQTGTTYQTPLSLAKVFWVDKLAEQILLHIPPKNLLCNVQRVCRQWHRLVQESYHLRHQGPLTITKETQTGTTYQTPPSLEKVFGVVELAEQILLHLSPENLLCKVQRVCRRWNELVEESDLIQEYLFFKPIRRKTSYHWVTEAHPNDGRKHQGLVRNRMILKGTPQHYIENPWLYLFSAKQPPRGSWQWMFIVQPPIQLLRYTIADDYEEYERQQAHQRVWDSAEVCLAGPDEGFKLEELYIAEGWATDWKPLAGWETIENMKKEIRLDEEFLEIEIALEMDQE